MVRKLLSSIVLNILLVLLFVYSNYSIWVAVNGDGYSHLITSHWSPIGVSANHYSYINGQFSQAQGIFYYLNYPFWLFFITVAANLYFIWKLSKDKQRQTTEPF